MMPEQKIHTIDGGEKQLSMGLTRQRLEQQPFRKGHVYTNDDPGKVDSAVCEVYPF